jgi:hypothetical protein
MASKPLATTALLLSHVLPFTVTPGLAVPVASIAASPWQPVARINPSQPYTVRINNQTGIVVEYASTTNEFPPRRLAAGASTTLSKLPLPVYLLISPINSRFNLKYRLTANQNVVTINVQQLPERSPGNTTVNIQKTGGIFVY